MITRRQITREEAEQAMAQGEFGQALLTSAPNLAVILTQDWCGQWTMMDRYLRELAARPAPVQLSENVPEICVAVLLYNRVPYFQDFLRLKERVWGNAQIPYVRYYRHGRLVAQSNYVSAETFLSHFRG